MDDLENFDNEDPPYSERDAGLVINVAWMLIGFTALAAICFVMGWK